MAKGQRLKLEQIVTLLQVKALTGNRRKTNNALSNTQKDRIISAPCNLQ